PADETALQAHLAGCAACRAEAQASAELVGLAKLGPPSPAEARALDELPARTWLIAQQAARPGWVVRLRGAALSAGLGVAAAAAALLLWPTHPAPVSPGPAQVATAQAPAPAPAEGAEDSAAEAFVPDSYLDLDVGDLATAENASAPESDADF